MSEKSTEQDSIPSAPVTPAHSTPRPSTPAAPTLPAAKPDADRDTEDSEATKREARIAKKEKVQPW